MVMNVNRPESFGGGRGPASYSYRGSELKPVERREIVKQNKSADSLKAKDLDKVDANKVKYEAAKKAAQQKLQDAQTSGKKAAAVAAIPVIIAAEETGRAIGKKQGSQADHHVTDNNNHTRPVTPAQKQAEAKRPMVGTDKSAAKKYGASSHNNGYTN